MLPLLLVVASVRPAAAFSRRSALAVAAAAAISPHRPALAAGKYVAAGDDADLISELLRRTEANRDRNAAMVKRVTEANAFTAIDGTTNGKLVSGLDGRNVYLDEKAVRELTRQRRIACFASDCRIVQPSYEAPPLELPEIKKLACDAQGRNCVFQDAP